jgi:hypothetical protein
MTSSSSSSPVLRASEYRMEGASLIEVKCETNIVSTGGESYSFTNQQSVTSECGRNREVPLFCCTISNLFHREQINAISTTVQSPSINKYAFRKNEEEINLRSMSHLEP